MTYFNRLFLLLLLRNVYPALSIHLKVCSGATQLIVLLPLESLLGTGTRAGLDQTVPSKF